MSLFRLLFTRRHRAPRPARAPRPVVLCVDDDRDGLTALNDVARREPWQVLSARSAGEALGVIARDEPTVLVTTQRLADGSGVELARKLRARWPRARCVVIAMPDQLSAVAGGMQEGSVARCVLTPWRERELRVAIRQCLRPESPATTRSARAALPA